MNRSEMLRELIKDAVKEIETGREREVYKHSDIFEENGITANMHVGHGNAMHDQNEKSNVLKLEWFAGALVGIAENSSWFAVNSWLNTSDKFLSPN